MEPISVNPPCHSSIDPECVELCGALNKLPGITTLSCCCGHGKRPYRIFFDTARLTDLPRVMDSFDYCLCGFRGWSVTPVGESVITFLIEGPKGPKSYTHSIKIAEQILNSLEPFVK